MKILKIRKSLVLIICIILLFPQKVFSQGLYETLIVVPKFVPFLFSCVFILFVILMVHEIISNKNPENIEKNHFINHLRQQSAWMNITVFILLVLFMTTSLYEFKNNRNVSKYTDADSIVIEFMDRISEMKTAINSYISATGDNNLVLDEKEPVKSVDVLLKKLQNEILYNGKTVGPFLQKKDDLYYYPYQDKKYGWKIIIDKETNLAEIMLQNESSIVLTNNTDEFYNKIIETR